MTAFSLRGSTALIALSVSLSLALPGGVLAQDTPAPAVAAESAWQGVTRLGLAFEVPPGAQITDESDAEGARFFAVTTMGADGVGARLGLRFVNAGDGTDLPAPGAPGIEAFLTDLGGVPVSASGAAIDLGGRRMLAYGGTGPVAGPGGAQHEGRILYLVSQEPEADGSRLLIVVFSAGVGASVAAELEGHFVASLQPVEAEAPAAEEPEDGASTAPVEPPVVAALEPAPEAAPEVTEPGAPVAVAEAEPAAPEVAAAESSPAPEPEVAATEEPAVSGAAAEVAAAEPAPEVAVTEAAPAPEPAPEIAEAATVPAPEAAPEVASAEPAPVAEPAPEVAAAAPSPVTEPAPKPEPDVAVTEEPAAEPTAPGAEIAAAPEADPQAAVLAAFAALPAPSGLTPEGWERHEAFGFAFAAPAEARVRDRRNAPAAQLSTRLSDAATRSELEITVAALGPEDVARMGATPGSPEFLAAMLAHAPIPVVEIAEPVMLGERPMHAYVGRGIRNTGPAGVFEFGVFLVTTEPDAPGTWYMISIDTTRYSPDAAQAMIAQAMASLGAVEPVAAPAPAPVDILADLASLELPQGMVLAGERRNGRSTDLYVAEAATPDRRELRVTAGMMRRSIAAQLDRMLHRVDALVESEIGGVPVWVVHGIATRNMADRPADAGEAVPAQIVAPRFCVDGVPPFMVGVLGLPGAEARIDALLSGLHLTMPEGAQPCGDGPAAEIRAMMDGGAAPVAQAPTEPEPAPAPVIPAGWEAHERFGLGFAAPAGMTVYRDRDERERMEYWLRASDDTGAITHEISLRVFTPDALGRMPHARPDEDGFAAMLSDFSGLTVAATDQRVQLGDLVLRVFRGSGPQTAEGRQVSASIAYLIPEGPGAGGLSPWIALRSADQSPEAVAAFEASVIASLSGAPALAPQTSEPPAEVTPPAAVVTPPAPMPPMPPVASTASPEALAWQSAFATGSPEAVLAYLAQYPRGLHSGDARAWLHARGITPPDEHRPAPVAQVPPPRIEADDWRAATGENRVEAYWTYLKHWPEGAHVAEARLMLERMLYVPPPADTAPSK